VGAGDGSADEVITGSIRSVYPRWDLTRHPRLPFPCEVVHATNHSAIPPAAKGTALVATVHDLAFDAFPRAFPPMWRWLYRAGLRAAIKRAHAIVVPSRSTADDLLARTSMDVDRVHVTPLAPFLTPSHEDPAGG